MGEQVCCNLHIDYLGGKILHIKRHLKFTQHLQGTKSKQAIIYEKVAAVMTYSFEFFFFNCLSFMWKAVF